MAKLYSVSIRWVGTTISPDNMARMDATLGAIGDWIRFQGWTWLVWTDASAAQISNAARKVVSHENDSVLVIACDPNDFDGFAAPWIWQWIQSKQQGLTLAGLGNSTFGLPPRR